MLATTPPTPLRLVRPRSATAWSDVALLAFVLAVNALPLAALAAGRSWGPFAEGTSAVVVFVAGLELARELRERARVLRGRGR